MRANRLLLDSAKSGHTEPSDQSAAKKLTIVIKRVPMLNFVWTNSVCRWLLLLLSFLLKLKTRKNQHNFRCSEYLCKIGIEYLNAVTCKFYAFSRQNSAISDISHDFLPLTIAKLLTHKNSLFFLAHPVYTLHHKPISHKMYNLAINKKSADN